MKKQAFNPYLPSYEYVPDGEPYLFGDRVYIYGSHDKFGVEHFCPNDYVSWSAPANDLGDWRFEGVIYRKDQDPMNPDGTRCLFAPDVQEGLDGKYYLFYIFETMGFISVAVCDTPAGKYEYHGTVHYPDGTILGRKEGDTLQFDPAVFIDDDGRIFLYTGFAPDLRAMNIKVATPLDGAYVVELETDMLTVKSQPKRIVPGVVVEEGTGFEGHAFFEASSMRKINGRYYFIYSSINGHELCYATGDSPDGNFTFCGTVISNGDVYLDGRTYENAIGYMGNNHGGLVEVNGQWYIFYHRQTTRNSYSRQGCAEPVEILADGSIPQVEMTSCGLNGKPLEGIGRYETYIACNLYSKDGALFYGGVTDPENMQHPYLTQTGVDREQEGDQYIANMQDGAVAGFKYFDLQNTRRISVETGGTAEGIIIVKNSEDGITLAEISLKVSGAKLTFEAPMTPDTEKSALFFMFKGEGELDFHSFTLDK